MSNTKAQEAFVHIRRRGATSFLYRSFVRIVAIVFAFLLAFAFLAAVTKMDFGTLWNYVVQGSTAARTSKLAYWKDAMLLLLVALALTPAFKMRFWNIGAQGQILVGALITSTLMHDGAKMGGTPVIILSLLLSVIVGGLWAAIPALFKVKLNANETLFTLMMNYIAVKIVAAAIDAWKGKASALAPFTVGRLPAIANNKYALMIFAVAILVVVMYFYLKHTKHGYEISVVGESLNTARYAGMNTGWIVIRTVFFSGALCGLCGFFYIAGVDYVISTTTSGSYGFTAIIVSWAASFNPFGMLIISMIMTFLSKGTNNIVNYAPNLNQYTAYITVGILLFFLIGCEFFIQYKIVFNQKTQAKLDNASEKIHKAMPWWFAFWKKVSDACDKAITVCQNWISVKLQATKDSFVKKFSKKVQDVPQPEPEKVQVVVEAENEAEEQTAVETEVEPIAVNGDGKEEENDD